MQYSHVPHVWETKLAMHALLDRRHTTEQHDAAWTELYGHFKDCQDACRGLVTALSEDELASDRTPEMEDLERLQLQRARGSAHPMTQIFYGCALRWTGVRHVQPSCGDGFDERAIRGRLRDAFYSFLSLVEILEDSFGIFTFPNRLPPALREAVFSSARM